VLGDNVGATILQCHPMRYEFPGQFEIVDSGARPGVVSLQRRARHGASGLELNFAAVSSHDLPWSLEGVAVEEKGPGLFGIRSAGNNFRVAARSLQIHESARIYGRAVQLARFSVSQRILWMLLLWSARFAWGQSLIRQLRRNR
jgi:hypothetical protein